MKLNGFVGKGSGKLGSSVFAISGGEQIVREYNPRVANPNTSAQVAQRAKMKLMSQFAAALAPGLAFKKINLVSARNQFVSKNIGLCTYTDEKAEVEMTKLDLTGGSQAFNTLERGEVSASAAEVVVQGDIATDITKVVFVVVKHIDNDKIVVEDVSIEDIVAGTAPSVAVSLGQGETKMVYAYGYKPTAGSSSANYGDMSAHMNDDKSFVEVTMKNLLKSGTFTATSAVIVDLEP